MSSRNIRGSALALLSMLSLLFSATAMAQAVDHYEYEKDRIYPVRTGLGLTTQIELSPNEKILDYSTGFSSGWELTRRENVFYLKPKNVDVDTNMMVRTETHSYIFELKVVATDWRQLEQLTGASWNRPVVLACSTRSPSPTRTTPCSASHRKRWKRRRSRC